MNIKVCIMGNSAVFTPFFHVIMKENDTFYPPIPINTGIPIKENIDELEIIEKSPIFNFSIIKGDTYFSNDNLWITVNGESYETCLTEKDLKKFYSNRVLPDKEDNNG